MEMGEAGGFLLSSGSDLSVFDFPCILLGPHDPP